MNLVESIKDFIASSKRVFTVSKKPNFKEFSTMFKVILLGVALIGLIGYIIYLVFLLMTNLGIIR